MLGFLLERVQHVNHHCEAHCVDSTKCVAVEIVDDFEHARTTKIRSDFDAPVV